MTVGGWVFLSVTWVSVLALTVFCFIRVFTAKPRESVSDPDANEDE